MHRVVLFCSLFATTASAADVQLTWSGRLLDSLGAPIEGTEDVLIGVYDVDSDGTALYSEEVSISFESGYGSAVLGVAGGLDSSVFQRDGLMYIGVSLDSVELGPRSVITTSPRAAVAETVRLAPVSVCDDGEVGRFRVNDGRIELCTATGWVSGGSDAPVNPTCKTLLAEDPNLESGTYSIDPDGQGAFTAWCDMTTADGGWTLAVKANNGDAQSFYSTPGVLTSGTTFLNETTEVDATRGDYIGQSWVRSPASEVLIMDCVGGNHIRGYMPSDWSLHTQLLGATMVDDFVYSEQCGVMAANTTLVGANIASAPATHIGLACEDDTDAGWTNSDDGTLISWYDRAGDGSNSTAHTVGIAKVGTDGGDDITNRANSSSDACVMVFVR